MTALLELKIDGNKNAIKNVYTSPSCKTSCKIPDLVENEQYLLVGVTEQLLSDVVVAITYIKHTNIF